MTFPRLPDWLTYGAVVAAIALAALGRRENADAPEAPPPPTAQESAFLAPASAFDHTVELKSGARTVSGTAFSVNEHGVWLTARHVVTRCPRIAIIEASGRGAEAQLLPEAPVSNLEADAGTDIAVLTTQGGAPALILGASIPATGERGFHPGFPQGRAGEATSRLMGPEALVQRGRRSGSAPGAALGPERVLAWAEAGRTDKLSGDLSGLSGAPVLNTRGEAVGVTLAQAPRRGRLYTTSPEAIRGALTRAHAGFTQGVPSEPVTVENYGRVADGLRRNLSVAQVMCLNR